MLLKVKMIRGLGGKVLRFCLGRVFVVCQSARHSGTGRVFKDLRILKFPCLNLLQGQVLVEHFEVPGEHFELPDEHPFPSATYALY